MACGRRDSVDSDPRLQPSLIRMSYGWQASPYEIVCDDYKFVTRRLRASLFDITLVTAEAQTWCAVALSEGGSATAGGFKTS